MCSAYISIHDIETKKEIIWSDEKMKHIIGNPCRKAVKLKVRVHD
jgi:hypothetical protein